MKKITNRVFYQRGYKEGFLDGQNDVLEDIKHEQQKLLDGWGHPKDCKRCKKTSPRRD